MRFFLLIFIVFLTFTNCSKNKTFDVDISKIDVHYQVKRFEEAFYKAKPENLNNVKDNFSIFFPSETPDSIWIAKMTDKDEQELFVETQKIYENFTEVEKQLTRLFKHIKFYYNDFRAPTIFTINSNIDYDNRIIYKDTICLISLDAYLGENHPFYTNYPKYISLNNTKNNIVIDVAAAIIDSKMFPSNERDFISKMIYEGKKKYLLTAFLPDKKESEIFGWEREKFNWASENEEEVWKYFIENNLLFEANGQLDKRFIEKAPFSKFYLQQDNLSPGQIGVWIGFKVVKSYMLNNDVSLQELLKKPSLEVYKKSKYKPKNNGS